MTDRCANCAIRAPLVTFGDAFVGDLFYVYGRQIHQSITKSPLVRVRSRVQSSLTAPSFQPLSRRCSCYLRTLLRINCAIFGAFGVLLQKEAAVRALIPILIALPFLPMKADAHGWYDALCCSDRDCQRIEARNVRATPEGWLVTVEPSDHPFIKVRTTKLYRYIDSLPGAQSVDGVPEARPSGDTEFHLCVGPNTGALLCLYVPEFGV